MKHYLCFDVGGTAVKYGVLDESGSILQQGDFKTPLENCRETVPEAMRVLCGQLRDTFPLAAIGISTAGQVELDGSGVRYAVDNLHNYYPTPFRKILESATGLPTVVENDVNAAALGEAWLGAGKGRESFLCLTIGTGVGGAIYANGQLLKGVFGGAGEFGHMTIHFEGRPCSCGQRGCLETYASHAALLRDFHAASGKSVDGKTFFTLLRSGDQEAIAVFEAFTSYLAAGLAGLVHTLDPGLIILGGAISKESTFLAKAVEEALGRHAMPSYMDHTSVVTAAFSNDAGILGACYVAKAYEAAQRGGI